MTMTTSDNDDDVTATMTVKKQLSDRSVLYAFTIWLAKSTGETKMDDVQKSDRCEYS